MNQQFYPWYVPKRTENIFPSKNLWMSIYSSIIHNHQKVETNHQKDEPKCSSSDG